MTNQLSFLLMLCLINLPIESMTAKQPALQETRVTQKWKKTKAFFVGASISAIGSLVIGAYALNQTTYTLKRVSKHNQFLAAVGMLGIMLHCRRALIIALITAIINGLITCYVFSET